MKDWVKLPTAWINAGGLKAFGWKRGEGSNHAAALMCLMVLAHHADPDSGEAQVTYYTLERATGLSRAKISCGLGVLEAHQIIERRVEKRRSTYKLVGMAKSGWGAFPARRLYSGGGDLVFLRDFSLRKATELNALKLLFLFVARRGTDTNAANISYDKITEYSGIPREKIRSALSLLVTHGMVHVDHIPSGVNKFGVSNAYRIPFILPHRHMGTSSREAIEMEAADLPF
ncbi:hypothetical protein ACQKGC_28235 [Allorhizobium pseudoryzae]|uniref:hypothetical protein n=1 Tax=Allorhizobium pseudoryzae TaxID=379684 RepID=UPI003D02AB59